MWNMGWSYYEAENGVEKTKSQNEELKEGQVLA